MEASHPVITLVAFVESGDARVVDAVRRRVDELADERHDWLLGPPGFFDETDEHGVRTVGVTHAIYAAFDGAGHVLDDETDRGQLDEVRTVVAALQGISAAHATDVDLELDSEAVGRLERGAMTDGLRVGLLESWASRFA